MSTYDDALKRLRLEPVTRPGRPSEEADDDRSAATVGIQTAAEPDTRQSRPRALNRESIEPLFVALLDLLLAPAETGRATGVVICGASERENVEAISIGLEKAALERHLKTQAVQLLGTQGGPVLHPLSSGCGSSVPFIAELDCAERPDRTHVLAALARWVEHSRSTHDFVLVEAPPLNVNVDGAILARSFSGLVIVFEPLVTTREALTLAVSRAKAAGCELLGLVMSGHRTPLPLPVRQALSRL